MKTCVGTPKNILGHLFWYDKIMTVRRGGSIHLKCFSSCPASSFSTNPRLTKLFSPMNLKNERLRYAYLVPWYNYGSLLSIHTKTKYKHPQNMPILLHFPIL